MFIWSGWGFLAAVFVFANLLGAQLGAETFSEWLNMNQPIAPELASSFGLALAAAQIHFFARWREKGDVRVFVDGQTGERIELGPTAGSFFFIPTRYWGAITLVLAACVALAWVYGRFF